MMKINNILIITILLLISNILYSKVYFDDAKTFLTRRSFLSYYSEQKYKILINIFNILNNIKKETSKNILNRDESKKKLLIEQLNNEKNMLNDNLLLLKYTIKKNNTFLTKTENIKYINELENIKLSIYLDIYHTLYNFDKRSAFEYKFLYLKEIGTKKTIFNLYEEVFSNYYYKLAENILKYLTLKYNDNKFKEEFKIFKQIMYKISLDYDANLIKLRCFIKEKEYYHLIIEIKKIIKLFPNSPEIKYYKIYSYIMINDYTKAENLCNSYERTYLDNYPMFSYFRAIIYFNKEKEEFYKDLKQKYHKIAINFLKEFYYFIDKNINNILFIFEPKNNILLNELQNLKNKNISSSIIDKKNTKIRLEKRLENK